MHPIYSDKRKSGIPLIGDIAWGTDFCQFYRTKEDLLEILVPYFRAGLENNESCLWITSSPMRAEEGRKALKEALPGFEEYVLRGQMEIIPQRRWPGKGEKADWAIVSKLDQAVLSGFDGLRLACAPFPEKSGAKWFRLDGTDAISRHPIMTLFLYPRDRFDAVSLMEAVKNHRFALVRNAESWDLVESSGVQVVKDALTRSEEKLHALFSNMSEGFAYHRIVLDGEGKPCDYVFHEINDAFERITGLKRENIVGKRATEVLPGIEKDPTDWIGKYGKVAITGEPVQFESRSEALEKWYSVSAFSPHKGYFAVTFSDITEQKRMEQAIRENEEKLRVTLTSIGDAVIATDVEARITFMNAVAEGLTGWTLDEASQKPVGQVFNIVNEYSRKAVENPVHRVLQEGNIVGLANHTVLVRKDGTEVAIDDSGAPIRDGSGNMSGVVLIFRDITGKRKAENALRRAKEEWERTFDAVPDLIAILDNRHRVVRANLAMAERLGLTPRECVGLPCYRAVHGTDKPPPFCPHTRTITDCCEHNAEVREDRLGGYFMVSTTPIRDEQGKLIGSVHVARDITGRKQAEEALRVAHDQLEARVKERTSELEISNKALVEYASKLERLNEELQDFAFVASHDLQEPLRKVQTFCDMAIKKCEASLDGTGKEYIERAAGSANRMRRLLQDLREFSRVAAKPETQRELDLAAIVEETAGLFEEDLKKHGGSIEIKDMPSLEADQAQMLGLFQNLIGNALKFRSARSPQIKVYAKGDGQGMCEIFVEDNGIGFDQKFAERIFKPFQRLHGHDRYDGTGMGLAVCRKIVEWHGGSIRAESRPGKGSRFIVRLPVRQSRRGNR